MSCCSSKIGLPFSALLLACCGSEGQPPAGAIDYPPDFADQWPEVRSCRLSPAPHDGYYIRVFTSPGGEDAYLDGVYPFEPGVVLLKGEYEDPDCSQLVRVALMERLEEGAAPELDDWRWERIDAQGAWVESIEARSCAGCHAACAATDGACTEP